MKQQEKKPYQIPPLPPIVIYQKRSLLIDCDEVQRLADSVIDRLIEKQKQIQGGRMVQGMAKGK